MAAKITTNPKEVIVVNCQDVPEMIYVETQIISPAAAKQKKNEIIYYLDDENGNFNFIRQEEKMMLQNFVPLNKPTNSFQAKPSTNPMVATVVHQPHQQTESSIMPIAITNLNNSTSNFNGFSNSLTGNGLNPMVSMPLSITPQVHTLNLNASVLPADPLGIINNTRFDQSNMKSVGIQCKLDDDLEDFIVDCPENVEENFENTETEKETFLKFITDNSKEHKIYTECLICGEVCKSNKYLYGHMAMHQGPKALCSKCGHYVDHRKLLSQHKCRSVRQIEKVFLQCPHHTCNVEAISRLELYDHINEHANNRMYKCSACRKGFCTGQEFLRHLLIRAKCYTSAKKNRFQVYGLKSQRDRLCRVRVFTLHTFKKRTTLVKTFLSQRVAKQGVCKICQRYFTNKSLYNRHRVTCISKFRQRLIRKRRK